MRYLAQRHCYQGCFLPLPHIPGGSGQGASPSAISRETICFLPCPLGDKPCSKLSARTSQGTAGSHLPWYLPTTVIQALNPNGLSRNFTNRCSFFFTLLSVIFQLFIFAGKKKELKLFFSISSVGRKEKRKNSNVSENKRKTIAKCFQLSRPWL